MARPSGRLAGLCVLALAAACQEKLDTTRVGVDTGTFGETVYTLACKRLTYLDDKADGDGVVDVAGDKYREFCRSGGAAPAGTSVRVQALASFRDELVAGVDTAFPSGDLEGIQAYVTQNEFLAVYEEKLAEEAADRTSEVFRLMAGDEELLAALARLEVRLGYRPGNAQLGSLRAFMSYDGLDTFLADSLTAMIEGGSAHETFMKLTASLGAEMEDAQLVVDPAAPDRTLSLGLGLLMNESTHLGSARARLLVRRDPRGLAIVEKTGAVLPAPFADVDDDGQADIDGLGRFVDASGVPIAPSTPFLVLGKTGGSYDGDGRALNADGDPLYRYVDLDKTVLVALAHESRELLSPTRGTALDLLRGASVLLGPRQTVEKTFTSRAPLSYLGYDTTDSALLDIAYGYLNLLNDPRIGDTLGFARALLDGHEAEAARLIEAMVDAADLGKAHPEAALAPGAPLYDDLIPVVNEILAVPGLAEDLLTALENPAVRHVDERFAAMMAHRDRIEYNASGNLVGSLSTPVDRSKPDSGYNRSVFQRLVHLIADASGARLCNKNDATIDIPIVSLIEFDPCELLDIPDLAVFFVQSIAYAKNGSGQIIYDGGVPRPKARLPMPQILLDIPGITNPILEGQSGIPGFKINPTPQALTRVLFKPGLYDSDTFISLIIDPARCTDGERFDQAHAGTLQALELDGTLDQLRPIVQAFADRNQEALFVKLLVVLHLHWASVDSIDHQGQNPLGNRYAKQSNAQSYEPLIVDIVAQDEVWPALTEQAATLNAITVGARNGRQILAATARYLFTHTAGLPDRRGATTTVRDDGDPVAALSPYYLLADAYRQKRAQIAEAGGEGELWNEATGEVVDQLVRGELAPDGWRFRNPRFRGVAIALIDFLEGRIAAHQAELAAWTRTELPADLQRLFAGPVFASAANFVLALSASPEARVALEDVFVYLTTDSGGDAFVTAITAAADLSQLFLDDRDMVPIARVAGKTLAPELGVVKAHVAFVQRARTADQTGTLSKMMRGLFTEHAPGRTALASIIDTICAVNRVDPAAGDAYLSPDDFRAVFLSIADFLDDEKRGLRSFVRIIENRNVR
jgi:hypothetical protein